MLLLLLRRKDEIRKREVSAGDTRQEHREMIKGNTYILPKFRSSSSVLLAAVYERMRAREGLIRWGGQKSCGREPKLASHDGPKPRHNRLEAMSDSMLHRSRRQKVVVVCTIEDGRREETRCLLADVGAQHTHRSRFARHICTYIQTYFYDVIGLFRISCMGAHQCVTRCTTAVLSYCWVILIFHRKQQEERSISLRRFPGEITQQTKPAERASMRK